MEPGKTIVFDEEGVRKVVASLDQEALQRSNLLPNALAFCQEIKHFLRAYLPLREITKTTLQNLPRPVVPSLLRETIAERSVSVVTSTVRYSGGAKERARERSLLGTATPEDLRVLDHRACAWCAQALPAACRAANDSLPSPSIAYCSQACAEEGRLRRGGRFSSANIRSRLLDLEGGICQTCGVDAEALFARIRALAPAERLNALCDANWTLPKGKAACEKMLHQPTPADFWQADHIVPVSEGGGGCGLENLRTLCTPCHGRETGKLMHRLKLRSAPDAASTQADIRSMFSTPAEKRPPRKRIRRSPD